MEHHGVKQINILADAYKNALNSDAPSTSVPDGFLKNIKLHIHQQAAIKAMELKEQSLTRGLVVDDETYFSSYAILGDSVGAGKSLMVLSHIARLPLIEPINSILKIGPNSNPCNFSYKKQQFTDLSEAGCLLVVPHTLYRQWANYIKSQTNLKTVYVERKKTIQSDDFLKSVMDATLVLVTNTFYKEFSIWQRDNQVKWKRAFFDEADTIHIVSGYPLPITRFTWYITASWTNMLFPNETFFITYNNLHQYIFRQGARFPFLRDQFKDIYNANRPYAYQRHYVTSANFFRDALVSQHRLRGYTVIRCSDAFIKESISLPSLVRRNILCRPSVAHQILQDVIPGDVQQLLHAGDTAGAIETLGVKAEDTTSLIDAVTKNLKKELEDSRNLYQYKSTREYATPKAKEEALKTLEDKIKRLEEQIAAIRGRIENYSKEVCPICYDDPPQEPLLTPCCSRVFCAACILQSFSRTPSCPMCRTAFKVQTLKKVLAKGERNTIVKSAKEEDELLKKPEALLKIFQENPEGRFLVFSRYDNPFVTLETQIEGLGVKVKQLKGNKDSIASILKSFQGGDIRCLLLNSQYAGSGLNITAATHVILLHAMTLEEEKQILGRAYRLGRTEPLHYIRLLHPDEVTSAE
jgi:hypothetical protein